MKIFGRKCLLVFGFYVLAVCLALVSVLIIINQELYTKYVILFYAFFFEITLGPVFWLYVAEFLIPISFSIAAFLSWLMIAIISIAAPFMISWSPRDTFFIYAGCCILGGTFCVIFLKETKGVSKKDLIYLYAPADY